MTKLKKKKFVNKSFIGKGLTPDTEGLKPEDLPYIEYDEIKNDPELADKLYSYLVVYGRGIFTKLGLAASTKAPLLGSLLNGMGKAIGWYAKRAKVDEKGT